MENCPCCRERLMLVIEIFRGLCQRCHNAIELLIHETKVPS